MIRIFRELLVRHRDRLAVGVDVVGDAALHEVVGRGRQRQQDEGEQQNS